MEPVEVARELAAPVTSGNGGAGGRAKNRIG